MSFKFYSDSIEIVACILYICIIVNEVITDNNVSHET